MSLPDRFPPEVFTLSPNVEGFELDPEVASRIVTAIYKANKSGQNGNNFEVRQYQIDPTNILGSQPGNRQTKPGDPTFVTSFDASPLLDEFNNEIFGRAVLRTFDLGERHWRATVDQTLVYAGVPVIGGGIGEYFAIDSGNAAAAAVVGAGVAALSAMVCIPAAGNLYRRAITNPHNHRLNEMHLDKAARLAVNLDLPPVVTSI